MQGRICPLLAAKMRNTKLSNPRDKIYATLGLLDECHSSGQLSSIYPGSLIIDYNASVGRRVIQPGTRCIRKHQKARDIERMYEETDGYNKVMDT
jgi:hypothetical protein